MREKKHWERQIVALGGANYTRNTAMLDEDGKQVPGTRGYKFVLTCPLRCSLESACADLPCCGGSGTSVGQRICLALKSCSQRKVRAMSLDLDLPLNVAHPLPTLSVAPENEEAARSELFQRFQNQGPEYYGDFDELSGGLLDLEREDEIKGQSIGEGLRLVASVLTTFPHRLGCGLRSAGIDPLPSFLLGLNPIPRLLHVCPGPFSQPVDRAPINKAGSDVRGGRGRRCRDGGHGR